MKRTLPWVAAGNAARGILAFGNVATGVVAVGGSLSIGVISIGTNAVGVVAIGLNAVGPVSVSLINGIGVIVLAGVNAIGGQGAGGVNNGTSHVVGLGLAVLFAAISAAFAFRRVPELVVAPLPAPTLTLGELATALPGEYIVRGTLRRDPDRTGSVLVGDVTLPDPGWTAAGWFGCECAVSVKITAEFDAADAADYREAAKQTRTTEILAIIAREAPALGVLPTPEALTRFMGRAGIIGSVAAVATSYLL